jgi:hypothetical protein
MKYLIGYVLQQDQTQLTYIYLKKKNIYFLYHAEQSSNLYDLIAAIHINASLIITTNRKIETWTKIFFDPVMANAALDRIVNNWYIAYQTKV